VMKLLAAALILPTLIVLGIAVLETGVLYPPPSNKPTQGIVWGGKTFVNRTDFARWLRTQGIPYRVWARRHPARAGIQLNRSAQRKAKPKGTKPKGSNWSVEDLGGGAAIVAVLGLGVVLIRRRQRPGSGRSPVSPALALAKLRTRLPRPVAEAIEESAWEVATLTALLPLLVYVGLLLIRA